MVYPKLYMYEIFTLEHDYTSQVCDPKTGAELEGNDVRGVLCIKQPWPGICRTVHGDHQRYLTTYMKP